jgi:diacylglycerol kinase family enzyme
VAGAAERAAADGEAIVAGGGDGTASAVASVAVRTGATFGVVPLGTLNHFARDAGIPVDLDEAIAVVAAGFTRRIDVGELSGRPFLNNVSLGIYVRLVRDRQIQERRGRGKWPAFALALLRTWVRYRPITVRLTVDGVTLVRRTPFVFVGNGEYRSQGLGLGGRCELSGSRLSVYVAPECGRFELLAVSLRAIAGLLSPDVKFEAMMATELSIETGAYEIGVAIDGEVVMAQPPLCCAVRRGALKMIVPAET